MKSLKLDVKEVKLILKGLHELRSDLVETESEYTKSFVAQVKTVENKIFKAMTARELKEFKKEA